MRAKLMNPQPPELHELSDLMRDGYKLLNSHHIGEACDHWLQAWKLVLKLATPDMRNVEAFDDAYYRGLPERASNWCQDLEEKLGNAGLDNPDYHEQRVRYARQFVDRFPDPNDLMYLNFRRAEGEALWGLGRQDEAEAVYAALVERLPDDAWSYIGWADQYWLLYSAPKDYARAEGIMQRALARPRLTDRRDMLERLKDLYVEWDKPDRAAEIGAELEQSGERKIRPAHLLRPRRPWSAVCRFGNSRGQAAMTRVGAAAARNISTAIFWQTRNKREASDPPGAIVSSMRLWNWGRISNGRWLSTATWTSAAGLIRRPVEESGVTAQ
jgi:tetratricopeptide (TPR) repeat protein